MPPSSERRWTDWFPSNPSFIIQNGRFGRYSTSHNSSEIWKLKKWRFGFQNEEFRRRRRQRHLPAATGTNGPNLSLTHSIRNESTFASLTIGRIWRWLIRIGPWEDVGGVGGGGGRWGGCRKDFLMITQSESMVAWMQHLCATFPLTSAASFPLLLLRLPCFLPLSFLLHFRFDYLVHPEIRLAFPRRRRRRCCN